MYKICRKCKQEKPMTEFYRKVDNRDGIDRWCRDCRKADMQKWKTRESKPPMSTQMVMDELTRRGIPVSIGRYAGLPGIDLAAYGSIPVEAKSAQAIIGSSGQERYIFHFTKTQQERYLTRPDGFIVFVAIGPNTRYFVVPASSPILDFTRSTFCPTINSNTPRGQRSFASLRQYENAFHLIVPNAPKPQAAPRLKPRTIEAQPALF